MHNIFLNANTENYRDDGWGQALLTFHGRDGTWMRACISIGEAKILRDALNRKLPPSGIELLESFKAPYAAVPAARMGISALKLARACFRSACAERTLERVKLALSSANGALRHAEGVMNRTRGGRI